MDTVLNRPLNIIVVEDHDDLREATIESLQQRGHTVRGVACAEAINDELATFRADLLVLDLNLPGEDGLSLARRIRASNPDIGIVMVTARETVRDIQAGYGSGADLYLTKPTTTEELNAAIQALARRLKPVPPAANQLQILPGTLQLRGPNATIDITDFECLLLGNLANAVDRRLETWQLMEISGKSAADFSKAGLEVQIVRLRKKLEEAGAPAPTIKAIRGSGYQLCVPIIVRQTGS